MSVRDEEDADTYYAGQIADLRKANAFLYEELQTARAATKLLDRLQAPRVFVIPTGQGVVVGGRQDGWLCWRHPDGQWVTVEKLQFEKLTTKSVLAPGSDPNHLLFSNPPLHNMADRATKTST